MAEEATGNPLISNRTLIMAVTGGVLVSILVLFFSFSGCFRGGPKDKGYTTIYSSLDLKDTANVVTRLKELKIPYEVKINGTAVAVPKERTDEARLGLAEKNLPLGGSVGWEIFNETRMGATDFDRRIQLIRAISGELSRTIKRIRGVDDARVQIVIPETRLFEATSAPVTAAVLLRIAPGIKLKTEQVKGIVNLVASSVENLKPENVTVVDEIGNILSAKGTALIPPAERVTEVITQETRSAMVEQQVIRKEEKKVLPPPPTKEAVSRPASPEVITQAPPRPLLEEEKVMLRLKAREEYERQLNAKAQEILVQFYPMNSAIVKVNVEFGMPKTKHPVKLKVKADSSFMLVPIKRITAVILVDKRIKLNPTLKISTYQTVAIAIGYDMKRGDRIMIKQVPFRSTLPFSPLERGPQATPEIPTKLQAIVIPGYFYWAGGSVVGLLALLLIIRIIRRRKPKAAPQVKVEEQFRPAPTETEAATTIQDLKSVATRDPQKIANLLRKWLTEE
jgi:flagellar M-ring protein FliF